MCDLGAHVFGGDARGIRIVREYTLTKMSVQIFNIWHSKLYDELYAHLSAEELENITMFGVNEEYEKSYTQDKYKVVMEYELPVYNPLLQKHGYCQTTCMWHVWKNRLVADRHAYVGFMQYDMRPAAGMIQEMQNVIEEATKCGQEVVFHEQTEHIIQSVRWCAGLAMPYEGSALQHYNQHFGTSWTVHDLVQNPRVHVSPLLHTFAMPVEMFDRMMGWLDKYLGWLESLYPKYVSDRSQSELLERCHGLFLALECARENVILAPMNLKHVWPLYHDKTEFKNYKQVC